MKHQSNLIYTGIDPGKKGGIAWLYKKEVYYQRFPIEEKKIWSVILAGVSQVSTTILTRVACIEWINPGMFGTGKSSMSKLYGSYMQLRGFLVAADIPFTAVMPAKWQKELGIKPKRKEESKTQWKDRLVNEARKLFPKLPLWKSTANDQRAIADALLIAHYCRITHQKEQADERLAGIGS